MQRNADSIDQSPNTNNPLLTSGARSLSGTRLGGFFAIGTSFILGHFPAKTSRSLPATYSAVSPREEGSLHRRVVRAVMVTCAGGIGADDCEELDDKGSMGPEK